MAGIEANRMCAFSSHHWCLERPGTGVVLKVPGGGRSHLLFRGAQVRPRGLSRYADVLKCNIVVAGGVLCSYRVWTDVSVVPYRGASSLPNASRS